MQPKRKIKATELVDYIRSGLTDLELMQKYQLSSEGLHQVLNQLLKAKVINSAELYGRSDRKPISQEDRTRLRRSARISMDLPLRIYEIENSTIKGEGKVRDISETGLGVRGIDAKPEELKTFLVVADKSFQLDPIVFQAQCRWVRREGSEREPVMGFEIKDIPDSSEQGLQQLIQQLQMMLDY